MSEYTDYFVNETSSIIGILENSNMLIAPLNNEETVTYLHSCVSLNRHALRFPHTQLLLDRILSDESLITTLTMKLGNYYIPIIGVNDFPEETYPAILDGLNRAQIEYRWASRYICTDKESGKKEAQKKEKSHRGNRKTFFQTFAESTSGEASGVVNHGAGVKEGDSIAAGVEIDTDIAALGFFTSCVMVWDADIVKAKKKADIVKNIINSAGFTCKEETFNALEAWKSMMPGQIYANFRALPVMTNTFAHVIPLSSVWAGMRRNDHAGHICGVNIPHLICSTAEGTPFYMNLNPSDVGHTAIWGPTGAGKSTLLNLLEMQFFKYPGCRVVVFDKGKSCRVPCLAVGGTFYEPAAQSLCGISFQPLRELETERDMMDAMDFIETLFTVNNYPVTPPMRAEIKKTLELLKGKDVKARTITSFIQYANYLDPETRQPVFKDRLGDYLIDGGKYGKIFDADNSNLSLNTRFLAIEMEELMNRGEGCVVPSLVYLFNTVEKMFDGNLAMLVLDEAWLFLKNETFSDKIAEWLKVLRKKNVFVVFATQDVADVVNSPLKTTVMQQCLTKIYLADPSAATAGMIDVYRAFGLTDAEIALIASSTMKRDYFYTSPLGRRLFQLDLGELTLGIIGSPDHAMLDELQKKHITGARFLKRILEAKNIDYGQYMGSNAPKETPKETSLEETKQEEEPAPEKAKPPRQSENLKIAPPPIARSFDAGALFAALQDAPERKERDGKGRFAAVIAKQAGVGVATVFRAQRILESGESELIEKVKNGEITISKACKQLMQKAS